MRYFSKLLRMVPTMVMLTGLADPVRAQPPPIPHAFYGQITYYEAPAPVGVEVEARGEGVLVDIPGNPIITTVEGIYGQGGMLDPKLIVQGQVEQGTPLTFFVNDESALVQALDGQWRLSFPYEEGGYTQLNLWVGPLPIPEPYLVSTQPLNAAVDVEGEADVIAIMNEDVILENAALITVIGNRSGNLTNGPAALGADHRTLTISHHAFHLLGERVTVTLGYDSVRDLASNPNLSDSWYFDSRSKCGISHPCLFLPLLSKSPENLSIIYSLMKLSFP